MMADELLNAQDLITAKKHDTFHSEVITGKSGGVSTGANIDYATNAVTGQTQTTLPKLLSNVGFSPAGFDFTTGGTLTERDKAIFYQDDGNWYSWGGTLPKVVPPASSPASTGGIADNAWNVSTSAFMYRDWEGFTAELLAQAGIIDDEQPDEIGASQRLDAFNKIYTKRFASVAEALLYKKHVEGNIVTTGSTLWRVSSTSGVAIPDTPLFLLPITDVSVEECGDDDTSKITNASLYAATNNKFIIPDARTYYVNNAPGMVMSKVKGVSGFANLVFTGSSTINTTTEVNFENINIYSTSHRIGENELTGVKFLTSSVSNLDLMRLSTFTYSAITDVNDFESYIDDAGKTRQSGFLDYSAKVSHIKNAELRGLSVALINRARTGNSHYEDKLTFVNCETGLFLTKVSSQKFLTGSTNNIKLINTAINSLYWVGKNAGLGINGKDAVLCEASYETAATVSGITSKYAIERAMYYQGNACISNICEEFSSSPSNIKATVDSRLSYSVVDFKVRGILEGNVDAYGFDVATYTGLNLDYTANKPRTAFRILSGGDSIEVTSSVIRNGGLAFVVHKLDITKDMDINTVTLSNIDLIDCFGGADKGNAFGSFSLAQEASYYPTRIGKVILSNVKQVFVNTTPSSSNISAYGIYCNNTESMAILDCVVYTSSIPFAVAGLTSSKVINSTFIVTSSLRGAAWHETVYKSAEFRAHEYDFECIYSGEGVYSNLTYTMRSQSNSKSKTNPAINWKEIDGALTSPNLSSFYEFIIWAGTDSFTCELYVSGGYMKAFFNGSSFTEIENLGSTFSTTDNSKIRLTIDGGSLILRTASVVIPSSVIRFKLRK